MAAIDYDTIGMTTMASAIWETVLSVCGISLIISAIALFIIAVYPFNVLVVESPLKVLTKVVEQGDCVFVMMDYNQSVEGPSTITAQVLTDGGLIIASHQLGLRLPEGKHAIKIGFTLPRNITAPGGKTTLKAKLEITSRYEILGFRNVDVAYCTEEFQIVPRTY